jgi:hypothetical protein
MGDQILTDVPPFGARTQNSKIIQLISAGERPDRAQHPKIEAYTYKDDLWQLFRDCWATNPQERPDATHALRRLEKMTSEWLTEGDAVTKTGFESDAFTMLPVLKRERDKLSMRVKVAPKSNEPISRTTVWPISKRAVHRHLIHPHPQPASEVMRILADHNCLNITESLKLSECGDAPITYGGYSNIYHGYLRNGAGVAIKCPRLSARSEDEGTQQLKVSPESFKHPRF